MPPSSARRGSLGAEAGGGAAARRRTGDPRVTTAAGSTEATPPVPAGTAPESPKARQILAGARSAFRELGFEGASVDEIARRAGVSKPTLYNHFEDKRAVFAAFLRQECQEQAARIFAVEDVDADGCLEAVLRRIARQFVAFLVSPFAQGVFRVAVAEAQRFPELGRVFYESGPELGTDRLERLLAAGVARGELAIGDTRLAAQQFAELCKADAFYRRLFLLAPDEPGEAEIARVADGAVTMFLRAYR